MTTVLVLIGLWLAVSIWLIASVAPPGGRRTLESLYGEVPAPRSQQGEGPGMFFPEEASPLFALSRSHDEPTGGKLLGSGNRWMLGAAYGAPVSGKSQQRFPILKKRTRFAAKKVARNGKRTYRETGLVVG